MEYRTCAPLVVSSRSPLQQHKMNPASVVFGNSGVICTAIFGHYTNAHSNLATVCDTNRELTGHIPKTNIQKQYLERLLWQLSFGHIKISNTMTFQPTICTKGVL